MIMAQRFMKFITKQCSLFMRCQSGVASVEFALSLTVLMILMLGSIDVSRCFLIIQKVERIASTVADIPTQSNPNSSPLTTSQMSQLMSAVTDMMSPYSQGVNDPNIYVIVSDVTKSGSNSPVLNWQYCGGGTLSATSNVGSTIGGTATIPNSFALNSGEEIVIGEVFYNFTPIIANNTIISSFQVYRTSIFVPRLGAITGFSSHC